jgi:hypothetical protein
MWWIYALLSALFALIYWRFGKAKSLDGNAGGVIINNPSSPAI